MRQAMWIVLALSGAAANAECQGTPRNERLDRLVALALPMTRGVSGKLDSIERFVRRDSGTARADSVAFRFWRANPFVELRVDRADAFEFEAAISPAAAAAQYVARGYASAAPQLIADSLMRLLSAHGIHAQLGEGSMYYFLSAAAMQRRLACCISAGMREYFAVEAVAQERPAGEDGSLLISLDEIVARIARAERFLASYPSSPATPFMTYDRDRYLVWVLYGIDNSPVFDYDTGALLPEYRKAMESLASTRATEHSGKSAQAMLDLLKQNGYRRTPAVDEYIRKAYMNLRRPR